MNATESIRNLMCAFPSVDKWFGGLGKDQQDNIRQAWVRQLEGFVESDITWAVTELIDGRSDMPPVYEYDRIGVKIRQLANIAAETRLARAKADRYRTGDTRADAVALRFGPSIKRAKDYGAALRGGFITKEENAGAMQLIHRFHRTGDVELPRLAPGVAEKTARYEKSMK